MGIFLNINNERKGPYTIDQTRSMLAAGQIGPATLGWNEGDPDWKEVSVLLSGAAMPPLPDRQNSRTGLWSMIIGLAGIVAWVALVTTAGICAARGMDEESPMMITLGLAMFGGVGINVLAIALGVIGFFVENSKKTFAIIGVLLNIMQIVGFITLVLIGLAVKH